MFCPNIAIGVLVLKFLWQCAVSKSVVYSVVFLPVYVCCLLLCCCAHGSYNNMLCCLFVIIFIVVMMSFVT